MAPVWTFNDFPSVFIPAAASNMEATKAFAAFLYDRRRLYPAVARGAGPRACRCCKTIAEDPRYQDNPIIEKYQSGGRPRWRPRRPSGHNLGWETARASSPNVKAGEIVNSGVLAEMVQSGGAERRGCPQTVVGETASAIDAIMKS